MGEWWCRSREPSREISRILQLATNQESLILDFFAGSGTTGQAVLEANAKDGGSRRFILITDNENGIAEDVCHPRIRKVIEGYGEGKKAKTGIPANLRYWRVGFVLRDESWQPGTERKGSPELMRRLSHELRRAKHFDPTLTGAHAGAYLETQDRLLQELHEWEEKRAGREPQCLTRRRAGRSPRPVQPRPRGPHARRR